MLKGYSRQPRSESQSLDYKFCVLFSIASDHGSHPEHCVEKLPNTSSVKNFRKSLLLSGSLVWGWWSEEKWDFHGDHFTEGHDQLPKDKHEAASKKHPRFPTSLPQTPQSGLRSDPQGLPSQISLHPTFFGCSLSLLSAFHNLLLALFGPTSRTGLGLLYARNILPGMDTWMVPSLP